MHSQHEKVEDLFSQALALPSDERTAFLEHACGQDAQLRERLTELLQATADAGQFLPDTPKDAPVEVGADTTLEQPGTHIGRYKLLEKIGEGGCGVVYMAEQEEPVRRKVALKIIKAGMDSRQVIARFEAERQALAMMDHPNIAQFFDAGTVPMQSVEVRMQNPSADSTLATPHSSLSPGRPYFVMELVRGVRITDYCTQNNLPTRQRLDLFIQVCHAVQHAHQKGIIHRDLKPSNILVTENDGQPVPKVIDFGIAKATVGQLTDKTVFTQFAAFMGTPAYMSPEQAAMTSLDIDTRSDIYSLGVLLYELLTGTTPFDAQELLKAGFDEMRRVIRETEPDKPSTRLTQRLQRGPQSPLITRHSSLATDLDWIVMKCLEKERGRRYETASGLANDLERHLHHEPVIARPPSAAYRFRKMVRRNRLVVTSIAAVLIALFTGLTLAVWAFVQERNARQQVLREATKSHEVATFLKSILDAVGPSTARGRDTQMLKEILDRTAERVGSQLGSQPETKVELCNTIGEVYWALGDYNQAESMHRTALMLARREWGKDDLRVASTLSSLAAALRKRGDYSGAEAADREALTIRQQVLGNDHPEIVKSLNGLGADLEGQHNAEGAEAILRQALALGRNVYDQGHPDIGISLNSLALLLHDRGDYSNSIALNREALDLRKRLLGEDHPETFQSLHNLALALMGQGELAESEALFRQVLATERTVAGGDHPGVAVTLHNLAEVMGRRGDWSGAEALHREALAIRRARLGHDHPLIPVSLHALARSLWTRDNLVEAESTLEEALELQRQRKQDQPGALADILHNLAVIRNKRGNPAGAEKLLQEALAIHRQQGPEPDISWPLNYLGALKLRQGNLVSAASLFREAYSLRHLLTNAVHRGQAELAQRNLIEVLHRQEALGELEAIHRDILANRRQENLSTPSSLEESLADLADVLFRQGKYVEAEPLYRENLASKLKRLPSTDETVLSASASLGRCLADWSWAQTEATRRGAILRPVTLGGQPPSVESTAKLVSETPDPSRSGRSLEPADEAEHLLRRCLAERASHTNESRGKLGDTESRLGGAIMSAAAADPTRSAAECRAKLSEAETLLLSGHRLMAQSTSVEDKHRRDGLQRLVRLYSFLNNTTRVQEWQQKLEEFERIAAEKKFRPTPEHPPP